MHITRWPAGGRSSRLWSDYGRAASCWARGRVGRLDAGPRKQPGVFVVNLVAMACTSWMRCCRPHLIQGIDRRAWQGLGVRQSDVCKACTSSVQASAENSHRENARGMQSRRASLMPRASGPLSSPQLHSDAQQISAPGGCQHDSGSQQQMQVAVPGGPAACQVRNGSLHTSGGSELVRATEHARSRTVRSVSRATDIPPESTAAAPRARPMSAIEKCTVHGGHSGPNSRASGSHKVVESPALQTAAHSDVASCSAPPQVDGPVPEEFSTNSLQDPPQLLTSVVPPDSSGESTSSSARASAFIAEALHVHRESSEQLHAASAVHRQHGSAAIAMAPPPVPLQDTRQESTSTGTRQEAANVPRHLPGTGKHARPVQGGRLASRKAPLNGFDTSQVTLRDSGQSLNEARPDIDSGSPSSGHDTQSGAAAPALKHRTGLFKAKAADIIKGKRLAGMKRFASEALMDNLKKVEACAFAHLRSTIALIGAVLPTSQNIMLQAGRRRTVASHDVACTIYNQ
jgi:hypothetical protein